MSPELTYFLKINLALILLYGFYRLFFYKDTYFVLRRSVLLLFFILAFSYPLFDIQEWVKAQEPIADVIDPRGVFVEMLKTQDSGQFSYFTAHPGVTRGGHYHHSKTEKFLVIKGRARFRFRHILTDEFHERDTDGEKPEIVETVPGWTHDITNIGDEEMVVMLWANEIFDRARPDTYARPL